MAHRATISADFPTNGRKVKILYHKGLFFEASRCLPHERIFEGSVLQKVMPTSATSKILSAGGFTKRGANFRISEGVLLWTAESRFSTGGGGHKHHLKNFLSEALL